MGVISFFKDKIQAEVTRRLSVKMEQIGQAVVAEARVLVPVDTGQLRDSIGFIYRQENMTLTVYADKYYALWVELGTRNMAARPFLRPALLRVKGGSGVPRRMNVAIEMGGPKGKP
jgi:HK97 gp10 family phage protein